MKLRIANKLLGLSYYYWLLKLRFNLIYEGTSGFNRIVSQLPKPHIVAVLKAYGAAIGSNCDIDIGLLLHRVKLPLKNLVIGNNVHIGHRCLIDLTCEVIIEDNSAVGSYTMFITHAGDWTFDRTDEHEKREKIHVGQSTIIYSGCIISPGVSVGAYSRVGANSTVLTDIPDYAFAVGSPAKLKKDRKEIYKTNTNIE